MSIEQPMKYIAKETADNIYTCPVCRIPHMKKEITPVVCPSCGTRLYYDADEWISDSKISADEIAKLISSTADGLDSIFNMEIEEQGYNKDYSDFIKEALAHYIK